MIRIILFLALIAAAALGAAYVAEQSGSVNLVWNGWRIQTSLPVFVLAVGIVVVAAMLALSFLRSIWRTPSRLKRANRDRKHRRGRDAITQGLLAIGHGDAGAARRHAQAARRIASHDPLALLLDAQSAQLHGDRAGAERAFRAMAERSDTRLLGLRGLFIEAQRNDDPYTAVALAEEALKLAPASPWASHAVLGFRCSRDDWNGALQILDKNAAAGLIDRETHRRQRGVLLTAQALDLETSDRDLAREKAADAVRLAPTLVPAAVLAAKFQSEQHQVRRAMKLIETAWLANPHPDLAEAYAHVRLGDSVRQRLVRVETLAQKKPGHIESALAVARVAIDAGEFAKARAALEPLVAAPTQRVAMLMAEIERSERGDSGRARAWMLRAVRALPDAVWTADGYVSDRWRPVSPVSGRIDAFQWLTPLAALPSDAATIEAEIARDAAMEAVTASRPPLIAVAQDNAPAVSADAVAQRPAANAMLPSEPPPDPLTGEPAIALPPPSPAQPAVAVPAPSPPVFRPRSDARPAAVSPIIPVVRAPDDPGVTDDGDSDALADETDPKGQQAGGWRGFLRRLNVS